MAFKRLERGVSALSLAFVPFDAAFESYLNFESVSFFFFTVYSIWLVDRSIDILFMVSFFESVYGPIYVKDFCMFLLTFFCSFFGVTFDMIESVRGRDAAAIAILPLPRAFFYALI